MSLVSQNNHLRATQPDGHVNSASGTSHPSTSDPNISSELLGPYYVIRLYFKRKILEDFSHSIATSFLPLSPELVHECVKQTKYSLLTPVPLGQCPVCRRCSVNAPRANDQTHQQCLFLFTRQFPTLTGDKLVIHCSLLTRSVRQDFHYGYRW